MGGLLGGGGGGGGVEVRGQRVCWPPPLKLLGGPGPPSSCAYASMASY